MKKFVLQKSFLKILTLFGAFPPPLGHSHCDNDAILVIKLKVWLCARPSRGIGGARGILFY